MRIPPLIDFHTKPRDRNTEKEQTGREVNICLFSAKTYLHIYRVFQLMAVKSLGHVKDIDKPSGTSFTMVGQYDIFTNRPELGWIRSNYFSAQTRLDRVLEPHF